MPPVDDVPAEIVDDLTPPAHEVPLPPRNATPFQNLEYDVRVTRYETTYGLRRVGQRLGETESDLRKLIGEDGTNGKVGNLRSDVGAIKKWIAAVAMVALTGAAGFVKNVFDAGEARGADRIRLEQAERTIQELRADLASLRAEAWRIRYPSPASTRGTQGDPQ